MKDDLINRQAAIDALERRKDKTAKGEIGSFYNTIIQHDIDVIVELPSAQPDIIHCKDCKHWMPYDWMFSEVWRSLSMDDYSDDEIGCVYCDMNMHANDFCSRAERRTDE